MRTQAVLPVVIIFFAAIAAMVPALRGGFLTGDDRQLVLNSAPVNHPSLAHALELLTLKPHRDLYQPIPLLSFACDFAVVQVLGLSSAAEGGEPAAWLFHFTNLLIHAINALLVWRLLGRLHDDRRVAFIAALIFAVHPLAVEPAAWLNGRMISLSTLFCLAALNAFEDWNRKPRAPLALLGMAFVVLAMASKVQIGFPVLMGVLLLAHRSRPRPAWWALLATCTVITIGFAVLDIHLTSRLNVLARAAETLQGSRIARTLLALGWYFQRFVCPVGLASFHPTDPLVTWSCPGISAAILTVAAAGVIVGLSWRWSRVGVLGMIWFLATIAATLPLLPSRNVMVAERYAYLPMVGLCWGAAALMAFLYRRFGGNVAPDSESPHVASRASSTQSKDTRSPVARPGGMARAMQAAGVLCLAGLAATSWRVASFYRDDIANLTRVTEVYPNAPGVWTQLAWAYHRLGRYDEAIEAARRDLAQHPQAMAGRANQVIGLCLSQLGNSAEAIQSLQAAVRTDPNDSRGYYRLAQAYERAGNTEEAVANYRRALERQPDFSAASTALAHLLRNAGRADEAARLYERVLADNPYDATAALALAEIEMANGREEQARARLQRLVDWMPENWPAWTNLGVCHQNASRTEQAIDAYRRALAINPQASTAATNLASLLVKTGRQAEAYAFLDRFTAGNKDRASLWATSEWLLSQGQWRAAMQLWTNAMKQEPQAPDLAAAYAWACVFGMQWNDARSHATTALNSKTEPASSIARMTLAMVALGAADPGPAVAWVSAPPDTNLPAYLDLRASMRQALSAYGEGHMEEPWPYYLVARLLRADSDAAIIAAAMQRFNELCRNAACLEQAKRLGIVVSPTSQPAAVGQPITPSGR